MTHFDPFSHKEVKIFTCILLTRILGCKCYLVCKRRCIQAMLVRLKLTNNPHMHAENVFFQNRKAYLYHMRQLILIYNPKYIYIDTWMLEPELCSHLNSLLPCFSTGSRDKEINNKVGNQTLFLWLVAIYNKVTGCLGVPIKANWYWMTRNKIRGRLKV